MAPRLYNYTCTGTPRLRVIDRGQADAHRFLGGHSLAFSALRVQHRQQITPVPMYIRARKPVTPPKHCAKHTRIDRDSARSCSLSIRHPVLHDNCRRTYRARLQGPESSYSVEFGRSSGPTCGHDESYGSPDNFRITSKYPRIVKRVRAIDVANTKVIDASSSSYSINSHL